MEGNKNREHKPNRDAGAHEHMAKRPDTIEQKPNRSAQVKRGKDPHKAIAELRRHQDERQKKEQQQRQLIILIVAVAVLIAMIVGIVLIVKGCSKPDDPTVSDAQGTVDVTPAPGPDEPTPAPTDEPDDGSLGSHFTAQEYLSYIANGAEPQQFEMLDVVEKGSNKKKRIAIVVCELENTDNLNNIITVAEDKNQAKLTLFVKGASVNASSDVKQALQRAEKSDFEIENAAYDNAKLFSLNDNDMARQIYRTQVEVNKTMGVNYEMHFLLQTEGGENDPRTHQYLRQLGNYKAVIKPSNSGSDLKLKSLKDGRLNLQNGGIYLFTCSDEDRDKLAALIPLAASKGFEMVTLNELLGYDANAKSELGAYGSESSMPSPEPYVYQIKEGVILGGKNNKQLYAIQLLQERLKMLGYLSSSSKADGDFGRNTEKALKAFQLANNLEADGYAGTATQNLLFSSEALPNPEVQISTVNPVVATPAPPQINTPDLSTAAQSGQEYINSLTPGATPQPEKYLPVIKNGPTGAKRIAITIDDLNEVDNLNEIIKIANENNAKLTLFAIGEVIDEKADLRSTLVSAYNAGFEIENHTYSHEHLYSLTESELAYQVYKTQMAVNNALGVEYEMHFLRMPGGLGEHDLRTHQYLVQLGTYKAIVNWTYSGTDAKIKNIKNNLKNGSIFLFHCKDGDLTKLKEFIPYAVGQGYELVTLNELLGYESNAAKSLQGSALDYTIEPPQPFVYQIEAETPVTMGGNNYKQLYAVQLLQRRLIELGYLSSGAKVDGYYGDSTQLAVKLFQYYNGLTADGYAGTSTQLLLFSSAALPNTSGYIAGQPETYPTGDELAAFFNSAG